ncbi:hypothetical protein FIBSPDRAFT_950148 [Athelia psychrophila]|uniref:Uncharacterized protein n=1 Tax=Athelia psychrophila TaxID=1759441 RepID=A0A166P5J4_9AGAM|nr:hypothetical protein FIBSPDRAFT_950148 [Fibularhizoctonia sp. CBS 109695]
MCIRPPALRASARPHYAHLPARAARIRARYTHPPVRDTHVHPHVLDASARTRYVHSTTCATRIRSYTLCASALRASTRPRCTHPPPRYTHPPVRDTHVRPHVLNHPLARATRIRSYTLCTCSARTRYVHPPARATRIRSPALRASTRAPTRSCDTRSPHSLPRVQAGPVTASGSLQARATTSHSPTYLSGHFCFGFLLRPSLFCRLLRL